MSLLDKAWNHDANEERRYLREGPRVYVAWCWMWTNWTFGFGFGVNHPTDTERAGVWFALGPISGEVYVETAGEGAL